jgi:NAD(P)-dependent dehydrogenase (short-subunit alcohol dehydrogenase family)
MDLARPDETAELVERVDDEAGGLDLVVANAAVAGAPAAVPASKLRWADVRDVVHVNVTGTLATIVPLIPRMLDRGHGHIVGISSINAIAPLPRSAPYGASKAALSHFLDAIGMELRPQGIAVTVVQPGFMDTPAQRGLDDPMPFIVPAPEAAAIIDAAIRRRARKVTFPWPLAAAQRLPGLLPSAIADPLVRWVTRER